MDCTYVCGTSLRELSIRADGLSPLADGLSPRADGLSPLSPRADVLLSIVFRLTDCVCLHKTLMILEQIDYAAYAEALYNTKYCTFGNEMWVILDYFGRRKNASTESRFFLPHRFFIPKHLMGIFCASFGL